MFAAESYISRHYIAIVAMACLCVLLGGPSCLDGYAGDAIGAGGDLVVTLVGQNSATLSPCRHSRRIEFLSVMLIISSPGLLW